MERQQLKWFTYATVVSVLVWVVFALTGLQHRLPTALADIVGAATAGGLMTAQWSSLGFGFGAWLALVLGLDSIIDRGA